MTRVNLFRMLMLVAAMAFVVGSVSMAASAADGQKVFEDSKCGTCHSVGAVGIEAKTKSDKMKGPDLSGYKLPAGKTMADLAAYVRKEADLEGKSHRQGFKGTDEELQTILDWLGSLEAQTR